MYYTVSGHLYRPPYKLGAGAWKFENRIRSTVAPLAPTRCAWGYGKGVRKGEEEEEEEEEEKDEEKEEEKEEGKEEEGVHMPSMCMDGQAGTPMAALGPMR